MCTVSMVGDHYRDIFPQRPYWPSIEPIVAPTTTVIQLPPEITRAEFDQLRRDIEDMKALLKRAKDYDEKNNEPDCEIDEKMDLLRKVAKLVGVDLDDVIKPASA